MAKGKIPTQQEIDIKVNDRCKEADCVLVKPFIYVNQYSIIYLKCNKDNNLFSISYNSFITRKLKGCEICQSRENSLRNKLPQNNANNAVEKKCKERGYILLEPFIFSGRRTKLHLKCTKEGCGHEWYPAYSDFVYDGCGCPKCGGRLALNKEESEKKVLEKCIEKGYILLKPFIYKNNKSKIYLKCTKEGCGHEWNVKFINFINYDYGCYRCSMKKVGKNKLLKQEDVEILVNEKCKEKGYILLKPFIYIGNQETILYLKCTHDDYEWPTTYERLITGGGNGGYGCPECGRKMNVSEKKIKKLLENNNINIQYQYKINWLG